MTRGTITRAGIAFAGFLLTSGAAVAQQFVISTFAGGGPPPTPVGALDASIGYPTAVATDRDGNVYFVSTLNCVFKVDPNGTLSRVAGNSRQGYVGDGGPAISAQLFVADNDSEEPAFGFPGGLAVDRSGNLYITDAGNQRVRKVSTAVIITTVAGNGSIGYSGDGGPAAEAQLSYPTRLAVDSAGNLYIAAGLRVRKVSPAGTISTVAETDGPGLAVDDDGNVYIAGRAGVRKVSPDGAITTIAGGPGTNDPFINSTAVALDDAGNVYVAEYSRVRKLAADGMVSIVAGGGRDYPGDGGPATSSQIEVQGLAVGISGNLYIAGSDRVRKVSQDGVITTVAGDGGPFQYAGDGGPAVQARLGGPNGLAFDAAGNLFIADLGNGRVRRVSPEGIITTVAGNGVLGYSGDGGPATSAQLAPIGLAVDSAGNLYIGDGTLRVRKVLPSGIITTIAGNGTFGYSGDGGPGTSAQITVPSGLAVDSAGNLFILDTENNRVRRVTADGIITTVAGNGVPGYSGDGGPASDAQLGITNRIHGINPTGLAFDGAGNLYIADDGNVRVRKVTPAGIISTVAGSGRTLGYSGDGGPATAAQMFFPTALAADNTGNLYIAEGSRVRRVSADGTITTVAGSSPGYSGDGGPAPAAQIGSPYGLATDSRGNVYVADRFHKVIRLLQPISASLVVSEVTNAASNLAGPIAPGEIVVISGSQLGPAQLVSATPDNTGGYATQLAGATVQFNGVRAPLIYTWATQVAALVPDSVSVGTAQVTVTYEGRTSTPLLVQVAQHAPGVFTLDSTGKGQAVAVNQDGSINGASRAAKVGDVISLYATGLGQAGGPIVVTIGGQPAVSTVIGKVGGTTQIDLTIPDSVQTGSAVPVVVQVGNTSSQAGVTVAVR